MIRMLLSKHKWDVDVFLERFYDEEMDVDQVSTAKTLPQRLTRNNKKFHKCCEICFDEVGANEIVELTCNHKFCFQCWRDFLKHTIDSGSLQSITCPGCTRLIDDNLIIPHISTDKHRDRYIQITADSFVQFNRLLKWCSAANCSMAIQVQMVKECAVKCICSNQFCFECNGEAHILINCAMLREFNNLRGHSLDVAQWLSTNSKPCPRCGVNIEKNGGCNFISCSKCSFGFCWLCLNPISHENHATHPNCQSPEASRFKAVRTRELIDCNAKYKAQDESIKLDTIMFKANLNEKDVLDTDRWCKVDFIHDAVEVLLNCRQTLKDSFIFQLLMTDVNSDGNNLRLFQMKQCDLRSATEKLSSILETKVDGHNYHEMKKGVQDLTLFGKNICRTLRELVHEGFEKDWWKKVEEVAVVQIRLRP